MIILREYGMNLKLKQFLGLSLLAATSLVQADCTSNAGTSCSDTTLGVDLSNTSCKPQTINEEAYGQTFFSLRPAHSDMARDMTGTDSRIHKFALQEFNGDVSLALQWQQTTSSDKLGNWFFFNGSNTMSYGPNWDAGTNYGAVDVNSLNFGVTASGSITATPRVQELIADFQLFLGWDEFVSGLWTRIGVPVNYVRTDMRLVDTVSTADANAVNPGYLNQGDFTNTTNPNDVNKPPYANLAAAWVGDKGVGQWAGRQNGNINGRRTHTSVSGLTLELGYDVLRREHGHLGFSLRAVAPTGNEPTSNYLFDAVVGANGCWEFGGGFTSAYELYNNSDDSTLKAYMNANFTHLFGRNQKRIMGLTGLRDGGKSITTAAGNGSELPSAGAPWLILAQYNSSNQYTGVLTSASDLTSLVVKVHNAVMADFGLSLKYCWGNYGFELGYNLWARTKDVASAREVSPFATVNYGVKAAAGNSGSTVLATSSTSIATLSQSDITSAGATTTAATAQYLTDANVAVCPALQPTCLSNKVFGSVGYTWSDNEWDPYVLIGGTYEAGCTISEVKNSAVSQWSVLAKGGIAF